MQTETHDNPAGNSSCDHRLNRIQRISLQAVVHANERWAFVPLRFADDEVACLPCHRIMRSPFVFGCLPMKPEDVSGISFPSGIAMMIFRTNFRRLNGGDFACGFPCVPKGSNPFGMHTRPSSRPIHSDLDFSSRSLSDVGMRRRHGIPIIGKKRRIRPHTRRAI